MHIHSHYLLFTVADAAGKAVVVLGCLVSALDSNAVRLLPVFKEFLTLRKHVQAVNPQVTF